VDEDISATNAAQHNLFRESSKVSIVDGFL